METPSTFESKSKEILQEKATESKEILPEKLVDLKISAEEGKSKEILQEKATGEEKAGEILSEEAMYKRKLKPGYHLAAERLTAAIQIPRFENQVGIIGSSRGDQVQVSSVYNGEIKEFHNGVPSKTGASSQRGQNPTTSTMNGLISIKGGRSNMEDALTVLPEWLQHKGLMFDFYGVYDGHSGDFVANLCRDRVHHVLLEVLDDTLKSVEVKDIEWGRVFESCFAKVDTEALLLELKLRADGIRRRCPGSTALVALVGLNKIIVANCGDCRAILCRGGLAVEMSHDHKANRPDERKRIEDVGGYVFRLSSVDNLRVSGILDVSRGIGDLDLKEYVIPVPDIEIIERNEMDEFIILATDGVWDMLSNQEACNIVRESLYIGKGNWTKHTKQQYTIEAAARLASFALEKASCKYRYSADNISIVVVML